MDIIERLSGVRCFGCGKAKTIVTKPNNQPLCGACNMLLTRHHGKGYAGSVPNPAVAIRDIKERKELKKDIKSVRKTFLTLMNLMDDCDLDQVQRSLVFQGFYNVVELLPAAQGVLTFTRPDENVKVSDFTQAEENVKCEIEAQEELSHFTSLVENVKCENLQTESLSLFTQPQENVTVPQSNELVNNFAGNPSAEQIKSLFHRLVKVNSAYFSDTKEGRDFYAKKLKDPDSGYEGLLAYVEAEEQRLSPAGKVMAAGGM